MRLLYKFTVIVNPAIGGAILHKSAENGVVEFEMRVITDLDVNSERLSACLNNGNRLRVTIVGHKEGCAAWSDRTTKRDHLRCCRRFIQERCDPNIDQR